MENRERLYFVNGGKFTKKEMVLKGLKQCTMPDDYEDQCAECPYFYPELSVAECKKRALL